MTANSQQKACINNLRQIDSAINVWALESGRSTGAAVGGVATVSAYIQLNASRSVPGCPARGICTTHNVGDATQVDCSLSTLTSLPHQLDSPGHRIRPN